MNISLTPELEQFISRQIESGKYASPDAVVLAGIRLLEAWEQIYQGRFEDLQQEVMVGVEQLDHGDRLDGRTVIEQLRQQNQERRQIQA